MSLRYIQYDSWFYKKGPHRGGVIEWYSTPDIYPNGMQYIFNQTLWPVSAHNRWWYVRDLFQFSDFVIIYSKGLQRQYMLNRMVESIIFI